MTINRVLMILILCLVFSKATLIGVAMASLLKDSITDRKKAITNGAENPPSVIPIAGFCLVLMAIEVYQVVLTFQEVTKTFL